VTLAIVVPLAVDTAPQASFCEDALIQLALSHKLHLALEHVDFMSQTFRISLEKRVIDKVFPGCTHIGKSLSRECRFIVGAKKALKSGCSRALWCRFAAGAVTPVCSRRRDAGLQQAR
jgi:hypothetical protein